MIAIEAALQLVLEHAATCEHEDVALDASLGRYLAQDVISDIDSPPHDKSMVDGYAIRSTDATTDSIRLRLIEEVTAGDVPLKAVGPGETTRIMTGAPIPEHADAVVMIEQSELCPVGDEVIVQLSGTVTRGQNIMLAATSLKRGDVVLRPGERIRPSEIGLLAEVGQAHVRVAKHPQVAILATGNELVDVGQSPNHGQIRNSNGPMMQALVTQASATPVSLGVGRDDVAELRRLVELGLQHDVLLLSGGVSAGVLDLVPGVLAELGVRQVFHKVHLKPGKPLWFGVYERREPATLVFGLPGNPVSSLVCFELFVRPALRRMLGAQSVHATPIKATLTAAHQQTGNRPTYFPAVLTQTSQNANVEPVAWRGSADQHSVARANCLAIFPPGDHKYEAGDDVMTLQLFDDN